MDSELQDLNKSFKLVENRMYGDFYKLLNMIIKYK